MTARRAKVGRFAAARTASALLGGGISRHAFRQPIPVSPRDEVLLATRRYNAMTAAASQRPLPARAWDAIADRLRAASQLVTGDYTVFCLDRANDAHHRAADASQAVAS